MKSKKYINVFKILFFLAIVAVITYVFKNQVPQIIKEIKKVNIQTLFLISLCGLLYQFFEGLSLRAIADKKRTKISMLDSFACSLYSAFYRVATFGSGTYISIIYFFKKKGFDLSHGFSVSMVNYMGQKIAMVFWAVLFYFINYSFINHRFLAYKKYLYIGMIVSLFVVIFFFVLCISKKLHTFVLRFFRLDKKGRFNKLKNKLENIFSEIETNTMEIFKDKPLVSKILFFNLVKYLFWYIIPFIIFRGNQCFSVLDYMSVTALIILFSSVIPAPGGMGSTEFVFVLIFSLLFDAKLAASAMLLYRFSNFLLPTIGGAIVAILMKFSSKLVKVE